MFQDRWVMANCQRRFLLGLRVFLTAINFFSMNALANHFCPLSVFIMHANIMPKNENMLKDMKRDAEDTP